MKTVELTAGQYRPGFQHYEERQLQTAQTRSDDQLIADLLYGRSNTMAGSGLDDQSLIRLAHEEFSGRAFSVVRDWMILDMLLPAEDLSQLEAAGKQPLVLLANRVVYDSDPAIPLDRLLVTGFGQDFFGCFFEVDSKVYVLAGRGARKYAAMPALEALIRHRVSCLCPPFKLSRTARLQ